MRRFALPLLVAALVAGCTSGKPTPAALGSSQPAPSRSAATGAPARPAQPARPTPDLLSGLSLHGVAWRTSRITPVSPAVAAGGRVLVFGAAGAALTLYALDPGNGRVVWSRPASTSVVTPGIPWQVTVVGDTVLYLRAAGPALHASLVALDAATGRERWSTAALVFEQEPDACYRGDTATVCALQSVSTREPNRLIGYRLADGSRLAAPQLPDGGRWLTDRVADLGVRTPERLAGYDKQGRQQWSRPLREAFGAGYTTDSGWFFDRNDQAGIIIGAVGKQEPYPPRYPVTIPADNASSAALRAGTGTPVWRAPHSAVYCNDELAVPSGDDPNGPYLPVRCRYRGTLTYANANSATPVIRGGHATVEGFDLRTGRRSWTWDAGSATVLLDNQHAPLRISQTAVLLPDRTGRPFVVDLRSGAAAPAPPTTVGWCPQNNRFRLREPLHLDGGNTITERSAGTVYHPCTQTGRAAATPTVVPADIAAHVGGIAAIAGPGGVIAYHLG